MKRNRDFCITKYRPVVQTETPPMPKQVKEERTCIFRCTIQTLPSVQSFVFFYIHCHTLTYTTPLSYNPIVKWLPTLQIYQRILQVLTYHQFVMVLLSHFPRNFAFKILEWINIQKKKKRQLRSSKWKLESVAWDAQFCDPARSQKLRGGKGIQFERGRSWGRGTRTAYVHALHAFHGPLLSFQLHNILLATDFTGPFMTHSFAFFTLPPKHTNNMHVTSFRGLDLGLRQLSCDCITLDPYDGFKPKTRRWVPCHLIKTLGATEIILN